jgi:surface polysaccharide O-acyltransferase-like enzyme
MTLTSPRDAVLDPALRHDAGPARAAAAVSREPGTRRADLDWIRVSAFGLLILYHVALVYSPYDWHLRSTHTFDWLRQGLLVTQPWRLTLLFVVSGAALRFMSAGKPAAGVLRARVIRLGVPLAFGVVALVPIQSWIEATDKGYWSGGLLSWIAFEFSPAGLRNGVPVNHLWFLTFICAYTAASVPLLVRPDWTAWLEARLACALSGWRLLVVPALYLIVARCWLYYYLGVTNQVVGDWYNHAQSFAAFLFGFLLVKRDGVWRDLERFRWIGLGVAAVALPLAMLQSAHPGGGAFHEIPRNGVYALDQWATIVAILGFASRHLRGASTPRLRYLNEAVFPCYLAHQTLLVLAIWLIKPAQLPAPLEVALLLVATFGGSLLVYEAVRRVPPIRPLWGLKPV